MVCEGCFGADYKNHIYVEGECYNPALNIPNLHKRLYKRILDVSWWTKLPGFQSQIFREWYRGVQLRKLDAKLQIRFKRKLSRWQRLKDSFQKLLDSFYRASLEDRTLTCFAVVLFYLQVQHHTGWSMWTSMPVCGSSIKNHVPTQHQQEESWMLIWLRYSTKYGVVLDPFACCA